MHCPLVDWTVNYISGTLRGFVYRVLMRRAVGVAAAAAAALGQRQTARPDPSDELLEQIGSGQIAVGRPSFLFEMRRLQTGPMSRRRPAAAATARRRRFRASIFHEWMAELQITPLDSGQAYSPCKSGRHRTDQYLFLPCINRHVTSARLHSVVY